MSNQRVPREDYYGGWHLPLNRAQQRNRDDLEALRERVDNIFPFINSQTRDLREEIRNLRGELRQVPRVNPYGAKRLYTYLLDKIKANSKYIAEHREKWAEDDHFSSFLIDFLSKKFPDFEEEMCEGMYDYHKKKEEEEEAKDVAKALLSMKRSVGTKRRRREREKSRLKF